MPRRTDISSILIIGGSLCVAACGSSTAPGAPPANAVRAAPADGREAALAAIADRCGLPRSALRLDRGTVAIQPAPDARYEAVDCMLRELAAGGFTETMAVGFVGNEIPKGNNVQGRYAGSARQPGGGGPFVCNGMDARQVLREIGARGADLSRPRETVFYFYGAQASLPGLRRELEGLGFAVRPARTNPGLIASRTAVVDLAWLERTMPLLCQAAAHSRVTYDGWEAALPEQQANR